MEYQGLTSAHLREEIERERRQWMEEGLNSTMPVNGEMVALLSMLSLFTVVGTVGNGLVLFVFSRVRDKTTAQLFILTLALIDLFTCLVIIPFTMFVEFTRYDINYDLLCKLYQFLITSKVPLSAFIMVAIAFDRYFCICHPLRRIITPWRTKVIIACLTLFASMLGIMTSLAYGVYQVYRPDTKLESELMRRNVTEGLQILSSIRDLHWAKLGEDPSFNDDITSMIEGRLRDHVKKNNLTAWFNSTQREGGMCEIVYIGICAPNEILLDWNFLSVYQKCYTALFFVCLVIVGVLYGMIYRFIGLRRSKKLQQKLILCSYVNGDNVCGEGGTRTTFLNGNGHDDCLNNGLGAGGVYIGGCVTSSLPVKSIKNTLGPPSVGKICKESIDFTRLDPAQPRSDELTQSDTTAGAAKRFSKPSTSGEANGLPPLRNDVIHIMNSSSSRNGGGPVSTGEVAIEMKTLKEQYSPGPDQDSPGHRCKFTPEERRRSVGVGELDKRCPTPPRRRRRTPSPQQMRKGREDSDRNEMDEEKLIRNEADHRDLTYGSSWSGELALVARQQGSAPTLGESPSSPACLIRNGLPSRNHSTSRESFRDINIRRYLETSIGDDCISFPEDREYGGLGVASAGASISPKLASLKYLPSSENLLDTPDYGDSCESPLLQCNGYPIVVAVTPDGNPSVSATLLYARDTKKDFLADLRVATQERRARFEEPDQEDSYLPLLPPDSERDDEPAVLPAVSRYNLEGPLTCSDIALTSACIASSESQNSIVHIGENDSPVQSFCLQQGQYITANTKQQLRLSSHLCKSPDAFLVSSPDVSHQRLPPDKRRKSSSSSSSRRSTMENTRTSGTAEASRRHTMESNLRSTTDSPLNSTMDSESRRSTAASDSSGRKKRWQRFRSKSASIKSNQSRGSGATSSAVSVRQTHQYDADRLREETRAANARTALMLFTVTLVFVVAFLPAWLMAHRIISNELVVFYLYFAYNVANPFIYAFMNVIFKDHLRKIFGCKNRS